MLAVGGRGFMRFAPDEDALLATDAIRRCADETQRKKLKDELDASGFVCVERSGLLLLLPKDFLIAKMGERSEDVQIDWMHPEHPAAALAQRWIKQPQMALTGAGRQLVLCTLRLTGQPGGRVLDGLDMLRAHAAVMLRQGDRSGMREAGCILHQWCERETEA